MSSDTTARAAQTHERHDVAMLERADERHLAQKVFLRTRQTLRRQHAHGDARDGPGAPLLLQPVLLRPARARTSRSEATHIDIRRKYMAFNLDPPRLTLVTANSPTATSRTKCSRDRATSSNKSRCSAHRVFRQPFLYALTHSSTERIRHQTSPSPPPPQTHRHTLVSCVPGTVASPTSSL